MGIITIIATAVRFMAEPNSISNNSIWLRQPQQRPMVNTRRRRRIWKMQKTIISCHSRTSKINWCCRMAAVHSTDITQPTTVKISTGQWRTIITTTTAASMAMCWWWPVTKRKIDFVSCAIHQRRHRRYGRHVHAYDRNQWKMFAPKLSPIGRRTTKRTTMNLRKISDWITAGQWARWSMPAHDGPWTIYSKWMRISSNNDFRLGHFATTHYSHFVFIPFIRFRSIEFF